ncbi:MAG TPA: SUMF1/EgtB/PvdO family nonheme iron enzyme, partial [Pyrinomonadaceae bacterium]
MAPFKFCKRCGKAQDQPAPIPAVIAIATAPTLVDQEVVDLEWDADDSTDPDEPITDSTTDTAEIVQPAPPSATEFDSTYSPSWQAPTVPPPNRRTKWSWALIAIVVCAGILVPVFALYGNRKKEIDRPSVRSIPDAPLGMAYIAGGQFVMGSDDGDEYERPAHKVSVAPFYMDVTEVTGEMYQQFVKDTGHRVPPQWVNNSYPSGAAKLPVTGVDWYDADAYAKWAKKRLPTEEEWEFAARSNDGRRYPWGNNWSAGSANAGDSSAQRVINVGSFPEGKTPSGLADLAGNAWEWTSSNLVAYPNGKLPEKPIGEIKVVRGGSWQGTTSQITTTYRGYLLASGGDDYSATG